MIFEMHGGSTVAALNYKLVGGTVAPASPAENAIWVNTAAAITDHVFSPNQPDAVEGRVWFKTGSSGTGFNALKKNEIRLCPVTASQYAGGTWGKIPVQQYIGGAWKSWWAGQLYENGDEFEAVTGGWVCTPMGYTSGEDYNRPGEAVLTRGGSTLGMQMSSSQGALVHPAEPMDLTDVDTIVFEGAISCDTEHDSLCRLGAWSSLDGFITDAAAFKVVKASLDGELSLDVSNLSGKYYVGFGLWTAIPVVSMRSMDLQ